MSDIKTREYTLRWSLRDGCYYVEPTSQIVSAEIYVREVNAEHDSRAKRLIEFADTFGRYMSVVSSDQDARGSWNEVVAAWHRTKEGLQ
jgi:hypothetical protein